jgi:hypothetical protein
VLLRRGDRLDPHAEAFMRFLMPKPPGGKKEGARD